MTVISLTPIQLNLLRSSLNMAAWYMEVLRGVNTVPEDAERNEAAYKVNMAELKELQELVTGDGVTVRVEK